MWVPSMTQAELMIISIVFIGETIPCRSPTSTPASAARPAKSDNINGFDYIINVNDTHDGPWLREHS